MRRRASIFIALAALSLIVGLYLIISWRIADTITHAARHSIDTTPSDLGLTYHDVSFSPRRDSAITLRGWLIPASDPRGSIIFVHGINSARSTSTGTLARELVAKGFTVLAFDLQAHGESDGDRLTRQFFSGQDVLGAFDYLVEQQGADPNRIGIRGVSIGAALTLLAAEQEPRIHALIVDSPFARLSDMVVNEVQLRTSVPDGLVPVFIPGLSLAGRVLYDVDIDTVAPERAAASLDYPILVIHGDMDQRIPLAQSQRILAASRHPGTHLWIVPGANHTEGFMLFPEQYVDETISYFEHQLSGSSRARVPAYQYGH